MSRNNIVITLVVLVIVGLGGYYYLNSQNQDLQSPTQQVIMPTPQPTTESTSSPSAEEEEMETVVTIDSTSFDPKEITIKVGDTVTWENTDSTPHQVASDPHPTHTTYPALNSVGVINGGDKKSFTFDKAGTYKYHDHLKPSLVGTVTVE